MNYLKKVGMSIDITKVNIFKINKDKIFYLKQT